MTQEPSAVESGTPLWLWLAAWLPVAAFIVLVAGVIGYGLLLMWPASGYLLGCLILFFLWALAMEEWRARARRARAWNRCPEHGPTCVGAECCCRDKHETWR